MNSLKPSLNPLRKAASTLLIAIFFCAFNFKAAIAFGGDDTTEPPITSGGSDTSTGETVVSITEKDFVDEIKQESFQKENFWDLVMFIHKSLPIDQHKIFGDQIDPNTLQLKKVIENLTDNFELYKDIQKTKLDYDGPNCTSHKAEEGSTQIGQLGSPICLNTHLIYEHIKKVPTMDGIRFKIAGLLFHEFYHHFQSSSVSEKENDLNAEKLAQTFESVLERENAYLEAESFQLRNYTYDPLRLERESPNKNTIVYRAYEHERSVPHRLGMGKEVLDAIHLLEQNPQGKLAKYALKENKKNCDWEPKSERNKNCIFFESVNIIAHGASYPVVNMYSVPIFYMSPATPHEYWIVATAYFKETVKTETFRDPAKENVMNSTRTIELTKIVPVPIEIPN